MKRMFAMALIACLIFGTAAAQQKETAKTLIAKGQEHMKTRNYAEAVASFEAALRLEPKNKQAPNMLREAQEKRTELTFNQAQGLYQSGKFTEAIVQYSAALRYMPPGYRLGSQISARLQEAQRALEDQQQQAQEHSARERAELSKQSVAQANEFFLAGKYEEAIGEYENAVKIGGLTAAEVADAERLTNEAKDFQEKIESFTSRPLEQGDFELVQNTNPGGVTIVKYKGVQTKTVTVAGKSHSISYGNLDVVIPARLANQPVTIIGPNAFKDTGITSVTIPVSVREIQIGAFANCKLKSVTIPQAANPRAEGLTIIRGGVSQGIIEVTELGAFENNPGLESIVIPNTVTEIGARAFKDCGLKSVVLGTAVREIGESAFRNNHLPVVTLPPSLKIIRRYAFHNNQIIAQTVTATMDVIFDNAFTNNPMTSVVFLPSAVWATEFRLVTNNVPMMVPRIGGDHFMYTTPTPVFPVATLTQITLPANMNTKNLDLFDPNLKTYYENRPPAGTNRAQGTYIREMSGTTTIWSRR